MICRRNTEAVAYKTMTDTIEIELTDSHIERYEELMDVAPDADKRLQSAVAEIIDGSYRETMLAAEDGQHDTEE